MNPQLQTKKRVYGGRPHAARAAERRAAFLEAGLDLIGTEGYRACTVRAVCKRAGFTDRYFYEAVGNTEGLLAAIFEQSSNELIGAVTEAIASSGLGLEDRAGAASAAFFRFIRDERKARLLMFETGSVSEEISQMASQFHLKLGRVLVSVDPERMEDVDPEGDEMLLLGLSLVGSLLVPAGAWRACQTTYSEEHMIFSWQTILIGSFERIRENRKRTACGEECFPPRSGR